MKIHRRLSLRCPERLERSDCKELIQDGGGGGRGHRIHPTRHAALTPPALLPSEPMCLRLKKRHSTCGFSRLAAIVISNVCLGNSIFDKWNDITILRRWQFATALFSQFYNVKGYVVLFHIFMKTPTPSGRSHRSIPSVSCCTRHQTHRFLYLKDYNFKNSWRVEFNEWQVETFDLIAVEFVSDVDVPLGRNYNNLSWLPHFLSSAIRPDLSTDSYKYWRRSAQLLSSCALSARWLTVTQGS